MSQHQAVAEVTNDSGKVKRIAKGSARVTGKIVDKNGRPLADARVTLQGGGTTVLSRSNGDFTLDSLPSGTQALVVRKLGYAVTETPVELSSNEPLRTTVRMDDFVPTLAVMRVEAAQDKALADVGFLGRKQTGQGFYMDGNMINHQSLSFSDVMRMAPGLRDSAARRRSHVRDHRFAELVGRLRELLRRRHALADDDARRHRRFRSTERAGRRRGVSRLAGAAAVHAAGPERLRRDRRLDGRQGAAEGQAKKP